MRIQGPPADEKRGRRVEVGGPGIRRELYERLFPRETFWRMNKDMGYVVVWIDKCMMRYRYALL